MVRPDASSVLISGAGIAGPTLAWWLLRHGFRPTLIERAPHPRTGGYVIDFWGLGYDIAERMGLLPALAAEGYRVEEVRLVDSEGDRVGGFGVDVFRRLTGGRYVSIPRSALARLIFDAVTGRCETLFDNSIAALEQDPDGVTVAFDRGPPRRFDLVIGADGLHSVVRKLAFGREDRFETYLGYVVAAFEAEGYRPRDEGVYVSYSEPGRQAARFALRGERTLFLIIFTADEEVLGATHDAWAQRAMLHSTFDDAGWECREMLAALDDADDLYFDRVSQIRMPAWSRGRVALVGDAAFCPSLLAGQGSALAMTAAYVLAGELARAGGQPEPALRGYETRLRGFIEGKQKAAAGFASSFAPRTHFGIFVRNHVTKAFRLPLVADLVLGRSLLDRLELPDYGEGVG
jgi:2-polyprenyl-6-methoxyphenol hydroxylase-like FAD-dependent oxidoreductase